MYKKEDIILTANNVNLQYDEKIILRDVNFVIHNITRPGMAQGQVVSLIGRSGVGKTQLFRILAGLINPTIGNIKIGIDQHLVKAGEVGIVPQNYVLFNHRTILENLKIGLNNCGDVHTEKRKEEIINEYCKSFDLLDHLKKFPMQLSGGQRQRVSIIQQVLTGNRFILLDEPFSGLDSLMVDKVMALLIKVSTINELNTLIIVSHDAESAMAISDTVYILANEEGKKGATITKTLDLIEMDMAWNPEIRKKANFQELVGDIKNMI